MKVYIGKYPGYVGPYQIADMVPFIGEETSDRLGDWLADTWVADFCRWWQKDKQRKVKVRIDRQDTWNMDETLAHIILPMLKQLKDTKHGSPMVDDEDVPEHMRYEGDNWVHYKWEWVLNEMIFAFETRLEEDKEGKFMKGGEPTYEQILYSGEEGTDTAQYTYTQTNPDFYFDFEGYQAEVQRMTNGFRLFGKYYQGLWD